MPFPIDPNLKFKRAASAEETSPLPQEGSPRPNQVLSWSMHWSQQTVLMLWSIPARLLTTWFLKDIEIRDKVACVNLPQDIGIQDSKVACVNLHPSIKTRNKVVWGDLFPELCTEIGIRLTNRLDILRFRSVCKKWRSSLPLPNRFPLRVPPPPNCLPELCIMPFFITEVNIGTAGLLSTSFEEVDRGGKCRPDEVAPLKSKCDTAFMTTMAYSKNPICRLSMVAKAYHFRLGLPRFDSQKKRIRGQWDFMYNHFAKKMVFISSNATDGVNPCYARQSDLSVVAHLSWGSMRGRLALLRLGRGGSFKNWEWDTDFCSQVFDDISTYRGRLCALDPQGGVALMDYNSLKMTQIAPPSSMPGDLEHKELCEALGELYMFDMGERVGEWKAYKLRVRHKKWVKVEHTAEPITALMAFRSKGHKL